MELPFGLATSVGVLPSSGIDASVEMALEFQPTFPTVPTRLDPGSSLITQICSAVPGLMTADDGTVGIDDAFEPDADPEVPDLASGAFSTFGSFLHALPAHLSGVDRDFVGVRIPVIGPVTLSLALRDSGLPLDIAGVVAQRAVGAVATAMLREFQTVAPSGAALVMLSEPGLVASMHPTFPLAPSEITATLAPVVEQLDSAPNRGDLLIGVHVAGRTDWSSIITSGVSVISAPANDSLLSSAVVLGQFLELGGSIAWGAVPVDQPLGTSEELLWRRLGALWCSLVGEGLDPFQLRASSLIGPVDGLGHFNAAQVPLVMGLVDSIAERVRRQAIGTRLSLGA